MEQGRVKDGHCRLCGRPMPEDYQALAPICPGCDWRRRGFRLEGAPAIAAQSRGKRAR